jgi:hypothetical protein
MSNIRGMLVGLACELHAEAVQEMARRRTKLLPDGLARLRSVLGSQQTRMRRFDIVPVVDLQSGTGADLTKNGTEIETRGSCCLNLSANF